MYSSRRSTPTTTVPPSGGPLGHLRGPARTRPESPRDLFDDVRFDDVAHLHVLVVLDPDPALVTGQHLARVVLEALQAADLALLHHDVVTQEADRRRAHDLAVRHEAARDGPDA